MESGKYRDPYKFSERSISQMKRFLASPESGCLQTLDFFAGVGCYKFPSKHQKNCALEGGTVYGNCINSYNVAQDCRVNIRRELSQIDF